MSANKILIGAVVALFAAPSLAADHPVIGNDSLGRIEATLAFCATVDPKSAAVYQQMAQGFSKDVAPEKLTALRATNDYKSAYQATSEQLSNAAPDTALKACTGVINGQ